MLDRLELPSSLLCDIVPAGSDLGLLKPALADELSLEGVRVVAPDLSRRLRDAGACE